MQPNFVRMLELVNSFFDMKNDPDQLQVSQQVQERLQQLHHACLTEVANEDGPILWLLMFPTTSALMESFLKNEINEQQLFDQTALGRTDYDVIYLCSVSVLPEFRNKGLASEKTIAAIESMKKSFPIEKLCVWPFSADGERLSKGIADKLEMPLFVKPYVV